MLASIKAQVLDRFIAGPDGQKIVKQIESEHRKELNALVARLEKLRDERDRAKERPAAKLKAARKEADGLKQEIERRVRAVKAAETELFRAGRLHFAEIKQLEQQLQQLQTQESQTEAA